MGNNEVFIVVESIGNITNAISELDNTIRSETNGSCIHELEKRKEQLLEILDRLAADLKKRANHS